MTITGSTDDANENYPLPKEQTGAASGQYAGRVILGDDETSETEDTDLWNSSDASDISEFLSSWESDSDHCDLDISE